MSSLLETFEAVKARYCPFRATGRLLKQMATNISVLIGPLISSSNKPNVDTSKEGKHEEDLGKLYLELLFPDNDDLGKLYLELLFPEEEDLGKLYLERLFPDNDDLGKLHLELLFSEEEDLGKLYLERLCPDNDDLGKLYLELLFPEEPAICSLSLVLWTPIRHTSIADLSVDTTNSGVRSSPVHVKLKQILMLENEKGLIQEFKVSVKQECGMRLLELQQQAGSFHDNMSKQGPASTHYFSMLNIMTPVEQVCACKLSDGSVCVLTQFLTVFKFGPNFVLMEQKLFVERKGVLLVDEIVPHVLLW